MDITAGGGI